MVKRVNEPAENPSLAAVESEQIADTGAKVVKVCDVCSILVGKSVPHDKSRLHSDTPGGDAA
jgi:hypothetical protein